MNRLHIKKPVMLTVPNKQLYFVLPFKGKMSALVLASLDLLDHYVNVYLFVMSKLFLRPLIV